MEIELQFVVDSRIGGDNLLRFEQIGLSLLDTIRLYHSTQFIVSLPVSTLNPSHLFLV